MRNFASDDEIEWADSDGATTDDSEEVEDEYGSLEYSEPQSSLTSPSIGEDMWDIPLVVPPVDGQSLLAQEGDVERDMSGMHLGGAAEEAHEQLSAGPSVMPHSLVSGQPAPNNAQEQWEADFNELLAMEVDDEEMLVVNDPSSSDEEVGLIFHAGFRSEKLAYMVRKIGVKSLHLPRSSTDLLIGVRRLISCMLRAGRGDQLWSN